MTVQFGLAVQNFVAPGETPDPEGILRYGERAEALGFESLWAWDHILLGSRPAFPFLESLSVLTALAVRTRRIRLGTGVLVLPLRNPVVLAKALATLDVLSGGRLILGVAAGWYRREFRACGVPFDTRGRLFVQHLDVLKRLWAEEEVTLASEPYRLERDVQAPRPLQRPRPPILVGGYVDAALRRAATLADGWLTYLYTPESFARVWAKVLGFAREAGRDPRELTSTNQLPIYIGPPSAEAGPRLRGWLERNFDVASWSESTLDSAIAGTVEECVSRLREHVATGVHRLIFIPYEYSPDQLEVLAREVLPRLG